MQTTIRYNTLSVKKKRSFLEIKIVFLALVTRFGVLDLFLRIVHIRNLLS